jgi:hypothetical protein
VNLTIICQMMRFGILLNDGIWRTLTGPEFLLLIEENIVIFNLKMAAIGKRLFVLLEIASKSKLIFFVIYIASTTLPAPSNLHTDATAYLRYSESS